MGSILVHSLGPSTFSGSKKHPGREEVIAVLRDLRKKTKHPPLWTKIYLDMIICHA
jgi:hypothetical protein